MNAQDIISSGLLELYAAKLTSQEESLQVEQWIKQYPEVAAEFNEIQLSIEAFSAANAVEPAPSVKKEVFARINETKTVTAKNNTAKVIRIPIYWRRLTAASIILLLGSVLLNVLFYGKYSEANKSLQQTQEQLTAAMESNGNMKTDMNIVQSKYSLPVALHSMQPTMDAAAKIFWMKNTGDVYVDPSNLPDVPQDQQFQLWAIIDGKPVDAGMIVTSKKGDKYRIQKMKTFGKAEAFAITIEKAGGSPTPTMDKMVVMGKL